MAEKASPKFLARLVKHVTAEGVTVTRTKKGLLFRFPNGSTEMIHFTPSDHRWQANTRASFRRAGISWPGDDTTPKVPDNVSGGGLTHQSRDRARAALVKLGNPTDVTPAEITQAVEELFDLTLPHVTASRMLYHSGFRPTLERRRKAVIWERELSETEAAELFAQTIDVEPATEPMPAIEPATVQPSAQDPEREFIDSVDSWPLNLELLQDDMTLGQLRAFAAAAGLNIEVRTWKGI